MIDCREAVSRMWAYLAHDLNGADTEALDQHLGVCLRCCGELEFSRELRSRVADAGHDQIPPEVRDRLEEVLDETHQETAR